MRFEVITKLDLDRIVKERNKVLHTLRTAYELNYDMQLEYYNNVLCNRSGTTRYYKFIEKIGEHEQEVGYGGLEHIEWENRLAEISVLIYESYRYKGIGTKAVQQILELGFNRLNLETIWGECYTCGNSDFWKSIKTKYDGYSTILPNMKYWNGQYWDAIYFNINRGGFNNE